MTIRQKLSADEQRDLDGRLEEAARTGQTETVRMLLASGADIHATHDFALCHAAWNGYTQTVGLFSRRAAMCMHGAMRRCAGPPSTAMWRR